MYLSRVLSWAAACQDLIQRHAEGPNIRGEGKFIFLQAFNGVPVHFQSQEEKWSLETKVIGHSLEQRLEFNAAQRTSTPDCPPTQWLGSRAGLQGWTLSSQSLQSSPVCHFPLRRCGQPGLYGRIALCASIPSPEKERRRTEETASSTHFQGSG